MRVTTPPGEEGERQPIKTATIIIFERKTGVEKSTVSSRQQAADRRKQTARQKEKSRRDRQADRQTGAEAEKFRLLAGGQTDTTADPGEVVLTEGQTDMAVDGQTDSGQQDGRQCSEVQWDVPMVVPLPIEILTAETTFPFLDATLANLGIEPSSVKERVVFADSRRTTVQGNVAKAKDKEVMIMEVRVTAQRPEDPKVQEVLYITETHSDRSFGRCALGVLPWKHVPGEKHASVLQPLGLSVKGCWSLFHKNNLQPVEMTFSLDVEAQSDEQEKEHEEAVEAK
ncbi:hypothetical protein JZ751_000848 [Albula glossodonta]|uniref:Uncharacterized protein n=1 Tax=Albula glossodonta TaxID=121402 RepID=A0A8T2PXH2_9TELE|nr:hypothetical protein JZ751_000848 [Albula glossodonta]